jgi:hypothetical protein
MQRIENVDVALAIRDDYSAWCEENEFAMRYGKLFTVRRTEGEGNEATAQPLSDVFNYHSARILALLLGGGQPRAISDRSQPARSYS